MSATPRVGRRFGRLIVLDVVAYSERSNGNHTYNCRCDCGNEKLVKWNNLARGNTKSCGCLQQEHLAAMQALKAENDAAKQARYDAYLASIEQSRVNGVPAAKHPLFNTWRSMVKRCHNPQHDKYRFYGARGVAVCARWRDSFHAFVEDVGEKPTPRHTLDRIDNDKGYEPGNCRWASRYEQYANRQSHRAPYTVPLRGVTYLLTDLCRKYGVSRDTVVDSIKKGTAPDMAFVVALLRRRLWEKHNGAVPTEKYAQCVQQAEEFLAQAES